MDTNALATQRQQLVEVAGIPGYMTTKTGGETSSDVSKHFDGGSLTPEALAGPADTSNVVCTKLYRPLVHGPILKAWHKQVGRYRTTVSVWDTDPDLGPVGEPTVYADALLVRVKRPDADAASGDPGTFELEFAVNGEA